MQTLETPPPAELGSVPVRVCISGEDLDWLGGHSVCGAIGLETRLDPGARPIAGDDPYLRGAWELLGGDPERLADIGEIRVSASAPVASGLGTSSSLTLLLLGVVRSHLGLPAVDATTMIAEAVEVEWRVTGGGGMDQTAIVMGGLVLTSGRDRGAPEVEASTTWPGAVEVVVIESGEPKHSGDHLARVRSARRAGSATLDRYCAEVDAVSMDAWRAISEGDLIGLGSAMNAAHVAMRDLQGMSTPGIEAIREVALRCGVAGAKLTGSGGGGAVVAVVDRASGAERFGRLAAELAAAAPLAVCHRAGCVDTPLAPIAALDVGGRRT